MLEAAYAAINQPGTVLLPDALRDNSAAWLLLRIATFQPAPVGTARSYDETYFGGKARNMHAHKREQVIKGRGTVGKTAVVGAKDRRTNRVTAAVIDNTDQQTLQGFVAEHVVDGAKVYTDDHRGYDGLPNHETVRHSVAEYVNGMAHTNGIESFWATLKRAHKGVFHKMSPKHLQRYVDEFAGKHNVRDEDTIAQMVVVAGGSGWEAVDVSGSGCGQRAFLRRTFLDLINARATSSGVASP